MSINNVLLVGRLGAPPERRVTSSGKTVCTFRVATDRRGAADGEKVADWHTIVAWERTAEACQQYLDTGSQVAVEGRLVTRSWDGPDGKRSYKTEVVARHVAFLGRSRRSAAASVGGPGFEPSAGRRALSASGPVAADDIPF